MDMDEIPLTPPWNVNAEVGAFSPSDGFVLNTVLGPDRVPGPGPSPGRVEPPRYSVRPAPADTAEPRAPSPRPGPVHPRTKATVLAVLLVAIFACTLVGIALTAISMWQIESLTADVDWIIRNLEAIRGRAKYAAIPGGDVNTAPPGDTRGLAGGGKDGLTAHNARLGQALLALYQLLDQRGDPRVRVMNTPHAGAGL